MIRRMADKTADTPNNENNLSGLQYFFISVSFLKAGDYFFFPVPFCVRWMQLRLSNSCWALDVSGRCPSSNLATEEDDFRAEI